MGTNREQEENKKWLEVVASFPEANFLQSPAYAEMNRKLGFKVIMEDFGGRGWALMIIRTAKRGRYLEIPCGPLIDWGDKVLTQEVLTRVKGLAKREKCGFVRMRPQLISSPKSLALLKDLGLRKSPMHLAAEHTVMIDLDKTEEELMAGMRRQTRYEVRRADKLGIEVTKENSEEIFREFHNVQVETAKRQHFIPPNLETLLAERWAFGKNINIYVARTRANEKIKGARSEAPKNRGERPIAYGLVIWGGNEGDYYEAASTELNRKLPGAYALLWQAMKDLKKAGAKQFNLWGIAPKNQPNHRYAGVTTFKTGFGGEVVEYVPAHDLVIARGKYLIDLIVETFRRKRRHL